MPSNKTYRKILSSYFNLFIFKFLKTSRQIEKKKTLFFVVFFRVNVFYLFIYLIIYFFIFFFFFRIPWQSCREQKRRKMFTVSVKTMLFSQDETFLIKGKKCHLPKRPFRFVGPPPALNDPGVRWAWRLIKGTSLGFGCTCGWSGSVCRVRKGWEEKKRGWKRSRWVRCGIFFYINAFQLDFEARLSVHARCELACRDTRVSPPIIRHVLFFFVFCFFFFFERGKEEVEKKRLTRVYMY